MSLFFAFITGLFATLHCLGMCGGIIGALSYSLPAPVRDNPWRRSGYILLYNMGRLLSYSMAGAIAGAVGSLVLGNVSSLFPLLLSTAMMAGIALYLGGWFPQFANLEKIGVPLWRKLEPLGRGFIPIRAPWQAGVYGAIWGWLPCIMIYSILLWAATQGSASEGALLMLVFGLGTLPTLSAAGLFGDWLSRLTRKQRVRQGIGLSLLLMAVANLFMGWD